MLPCAERGRSGLSAGQSRSTLVCEFVWTESARAQFWRLSTTRPCLPNARGGPGNGRGSRLSNLHAQRAGPESSRFAARNAHRRSPSEQRKNCMELLSRLS